MGPYRRGYSAHLVAKQSKSGGGDDPSPSFTPLLSIHNQHGEDAPTPSPSQTTPNRLGLACGWLRTFKHSSLRDRHLHSSTVFRTCMSYDNDSNGYHPCPFSPALLHTVTFPDNVIPEAQYTLTCAQSPSAMSDDLTTLETESVNSKHSNGDCPAAKSLPQKVCGSMESSEKASTRALRSDCSGISLCHTEEGESWCGNYGDLCGEGEEEGEEEVDGRDYSDCDSQSDDDIVFSNELGSSEQRDSLEPCIPHQDKALSQNLMSLLSEESGYGENSFTESYSDWEWDDDEHETECGAEGISCKDDETWKRFEGQALSFSSTHCCSSASLNSACSGSHSPTTCSQQTPSTKRNSLKHSHFLQRLSVSHVCAHRHVNCYPSRTQENHHSRESSPSTSSQVTSCRKKVSFVRDSELVHVHHIIVWNYAYRSCRRGPWEQYARDRGHFKCRIDRISSVIEPCLRKKLELMST